MILFHVGGVISTRDEQIVAILMGGIRMKTKVLLIPLRDVQFLAETVEKAIQYWLDRTPGIEIVTMCQSVYRGLLVDQELMVTIVYH